MRRLFFLALLLPLCASAQTYVRGGAAFERGGSTTVRDVRCRNTQPPALFGCGFRADGDLGSSVVPEVAVGLEVSPRSRFELALSRRALDLEANSNFTGVSESQPVTSGVRSLTLMIQGAVDLAPASWRVRPFVTAGAGIAQNTLDEVVYAFPSIGPEAVTITQGGAYTDLATTAGAGISVPLASSLTLDVAYRWTDLGDARTDVGAATIIRPTRELTIDIDATRADLETSGVSVSLRWRAQPRNQRSGV
jgi:opacity protein-like surface antigen